MKHKERHIAVDLDGTLAEYHGYEGDHVIGNPIAPMMERVHMWLAEGHKVSIFTARADCQSAIGHVERWLDKQGLPELLVTNVKLKEFTEFWDDRAIGIIPNTGHEAPCIANTNVNPTALQGQVGGEHYKQMKIQPIEFCHHNKIPCIEAEALTHIVRHSFKDGAKDLRKAIHLIEILLEFEYENTNVHTK